LFSNKMKQELQDKGIMVRAVQVSRVMTTFSSRKVVVKKAMAQKTKPPQNDSKKVEEPIKSSANTSETAEHTTDSTESTLAPATAEAPVFPLLGAVPCVEPEVLSPESVTKEYVVVSDELADVLAETSIVPDVTAVSPQREEKTSDQQDDVVPDVPIREVVQEVVGEVSSSKKKRLRKKRNSSQSSSQSATHSEIQQGPDITTMIEQACHDIPDSLDVD